MAIPKTIYQTFKTKQLPFLTRWHIARFRKNNPEYAYEFYDDNRIIKFFQEEFDPEVLQAYLKLNIGAAKADMFRYAILLKKGGVYLDIDSNINGRLDDFILPDDTAIISKEKNPILFVQWALIFEAGHPILHRTFELVLENIRRDRYPHDVHAMTGPTVFTKSVKEFVTKKSDVPYRIMGVDYDGHLKFKYKLSKLSLYDRGEHWKKKQLATPVVRKPAGYVSRNADAGIDNIYVASAMAGNQHCEEQLKNLLKEKHNLTYQLVTEFEDVNHNEQLLTRYFTPEACKQLPKNMSMRTLMHILVYEQIIKNSDEVALIFENDVLLMRDFNAEIKRVMNEARQLPEGWLISLDNPTLNFPSVWKTKKNKYLYETSFRHQSSAYLIDNQAAKIILNNLQTNKCPSGINQWHKLLVEKSILRMYQAHPPLAECNPSIGISHSALTGSSQERKQLWSRQINKLYRTYIGRLFKSTGI